MLAASSINVLRMSDISNTGDCWNNILKECLQALNTRDEKSGFVLAIVESIQEKNGTQIGTCNSIHFPKTVTQLTNLTKTVCSDDSVSW
jgi:hypothetical protein